MKYSPGRSAIFAAARMESVLSGRGKRGGRFLLSIIAIVIMTSNGLLVGSSPAQAAEEMSISELESEKARLLREIEELTTQAETLRAKVEDPALPDRADNDERAATEEDAFAQDAEFLAEQEMLERDRADLLREMQVLHDELTAEQSENAAEPPAGTVPKEAPALRDLIVEIQTVLRDAGCYTRAIDGIWGTGSSRGVVEFARQKGLALDAADPSPEMASALRENYSGGRVCPLVCDARHEQKGDACVMKSCASGQTLNRNGQCAAPRENDNCRGYRLSPRPNRQACDFYLAVSRSGDWGTADRDASRRHYQCNCQ